MKIAIISEKRWKTIGYLVDSFTKLGIQVDVLELSKTGLFVENQVSHIMYDDAYLSDYDAFYFHVPPRFTLFMEPLLDDLESKNIPSQLHKKTFNILANKPFLYATLNAHGIKTPKTTILSDLSLVKETIKNFMYPIRIEAFNGLNKTQRMIIENENILLPFIKSIPFQADVIVAQEYTKTDLIEHLVIGDEVYSIKREWIDEELTHSSDTLQIEISGEKKMEILLAAKSIGLKIATVREINNLITNVKAKLNLNKWDTALDINLYETIATYYQTLLEVKKE